MTVRTTMAVVLIGCWLNNSASGQKSLLKRATAAAIKKSQELVSAMRSSDSLKAAGFAMRNVRVDIALRPAVEVDFVRKRVLEPAAQKKLIDAIEDKKLRAAIGALFAASNVEFEGYRLRKVTLVLSLPPKTTVVYEPIE